MESQGIQQHEVMDTSQNSYLLLIQPIFKRDQIQGITFENYLGSLQTVKEFVILEVVENQIKKLVLTFHQIDDALDFHQEVKHDIQFLQAILKSSLQELHEHSSTGISEVSFQDDIDLADFELKNGELKLKRKTSLDQFCGKEDEFNDVSTLSSSQIGRDREQIDDEDSDEQVQFKKQQVIKPLAEGVLMLAFFYGAYNVISVFIF